jgi:plasmid stabilization system protein ParE
MIGYDFHPEARLDLDEIWEFIRADNLDAADRVIAEILAAVDGLVPFPKNSACYEPFGADDGRPTRAPCADDIVRPPPLPSGKSRSSCGSV